MNEVTMKSKHLHIVAITIAFSLLQYCASSDPGKKTVLEESKTTDSKTTNQFESLPQGFINSGTFQVVVSSLKQDASQAESEALSVAQKKSFQMLQSYPKNPLTPKGRTELKSISESGGITQKGVVGSKRYFVYQISRTGLKVLVESKLP
jgi:PBP1b-binding outer membrane lipoprotein LpoB